MDELNAVLGLVRVFSAERLGEGEGHRWLDETLRRLQNQLFDLGSELATPEDAVYEGMYRVGQAEVTELEQLIDRCQEELEPLKSFVLPGGGRSGRSSTRRGQCAAAPSGRSCGSHARSLFPSGLSAT